MFLADLSQVEGATENVNNLFGEGKQVFLAAPHPIQGLYPRGFLHRLCQNIPKWAYNANGCFCLFLCCTSSCQAAFLDTTVVIQNFLSACPPASATITLLILAARGTDGPSLGIQFRSLCSTRFYAFKPDPFSAQLFGVHLLFRRRRRFRQIASTPG